MAMNRQERRNAEQAHNSRGKIKEFRLVKHLVINAEAESELSVESETDQEIVSKISTYDRKSSNFLLSSMNNPLCNLYIYI